MVDEAILKSLCALRLIICKHSYLLDGMMAWLLEAQGIDGLYVPIQGSLIRMQNRDHLSCQRETVTYPA